MPLEPKNRALDALAAVANAMYRGVLVVKSYVTDDAGTGKLGFIQASGRGDPDSAEGEVVQEADLDHTQHFGFCSNPPADTELIIVDVDGGECVIAERDSMSTSIPDRATGDTVLYDSGNQYVQLDQDSKIVIKSPVGNVEIIAKAGSQVKIGHDGATYRDIAYAHNTEAGASKVASGATLNTWTHNVKSDIDAIHTDLDTCLKAGNPGLLWDHATWINAILLWARNAGGAPAPPPAAMPSGGTAAYPVGDTVAPDTTDGINTDVDHSYVSSGSTKAEVEP